MHRAPDWERMEMYGRNEGRGRIDGLCSTPEGLGECSIKGRGTMWEEIERLGSLKDTILVSHGPPYGTCTDMSFSGSHLGSFDLTRAVIRDPPLAILCGHIHESPEISGRPVCRIGKTQIANPGSRLGSLSFIIGRYLDDLVLQQGSIP